MSEFVSKVEEIVQKHDSDKEEAAKNKRLKQEREAAVHPAIINAMNELFNNSTLVTNYKDVLRLTPNTDIYRLEIAGYVVNLHKATILASIHKNPNLDLEKFIRDAILSELEHMDLPF